MTSSGAKRCRMPSNTAAKDVWNSSGERTQPWRGLCSTSNRSDYSPSCTRTRARMPSWNRRTTVIIVVGELAPQTSAVEGIVHVLEANKVHAQRDLLAPSVFNAICAQNNTSR